ncbi:hypothetical protein [Arcobacter roscoffensis]|uniref:Uncharacterized protein n=1 Tax=Arcobacter roscoffensis TaxID=2961520 RepID=A0ABY5E6V4_9BACT|nr:hypothetical protein [Arcobacter roscoffensis]UTJ06485.1 hypothetical protein NJU99_14765 [Arcobacter roscoffensis]
MSLRIIDKDVYLNDTVISTRDFIDQSIVEVVNIQKEHISDFYRLKNTDICENVEVYCDNDTYSLNMFREDNKSFISKSIEILDKDEVISIEDFNKLIAEEFSKINEVEVFADEDSIEDSLNIVLSTQLSDSECVEEANSKIDSAYKELITKIFNS